MAHFEKGSVDLCSIMDVIVLILILNHIKKSFSGFFLIFHSQPFAYTERRRGPFLSGLSTISGRLLCLNPLRKWLFYPLSSLSSLKEGRMGDELTISGNKKSHPCERIEVLLLFQKRKLIWSIGTSSLTV